MSTCRELAVTVGVQTSVRNDIFTEVGELSAETNPAETSTNKEARRVKEDFSRQHMQLNEESQLEKKFNLDGPDSFSHYFQDFKKEQVVLGKRQMRGGGVMIWAGIGY